SLGEIEDGQFIIEFSGYLEQSFLSRELKEFYAIARMDQSILGQSKLFPGIGVLPGNVEEVAFTNLVDRGINYRAITFVSEIRVENNDVTDGWLPVIVYFASSREKMEAELRGISAFLVITSLMLLAVTAILGHFMIRRGLLSLNEM